ncbi:MAG: cytochrome c, partial [Myxococcales bacterium]|nr:cytochrome c [Myxococcales bacterium]
AERARAIADEPRLARPVGDTTLNAVIPPAFFDLQDLLHHRAEALEAAARAQDGPRVRAAYESLGETCGQCHQVWFPVP